MIYHLRVTNERVAKRFQVHRRFHSGRKKENIDELPAAPIESQCSYSSFSALTPFLLHESWTACLALISAGVMLAGAEETIPVGVQFVANVGVTVANAPTTDRNVLHRVVILRWGRKKSGKVERSEIEER